MSHPLDVFALFTTAKELTAELKVMQELSVRGPASQGRTDRAGLWGPESHLSPVPPSLLCASSCVPWPLGPHL